MKTINRLQATGKVHLIAFALFVAVAAAGCKKEPQTPEKKCDTTGRFIYMQSVGGFYTDYVIELNTGETILPCMVEDNTIRPSEIYDNMAITLSYQVSISNEVNCQNSKILPGGCVVYPSAKITCIGAQTEKEPIGWCGTR